MSASSRKQMRHMPKSRMNARGRPQRRHRLYFRTANFGVRLHFSMSDFFAKAPSSQFFRNGNWSNRSNSIPSSSVRAVVTRVMFMPRIFATLSMSISGKTICSRMPIV